MNLSLLTTYLGLLLTICGISTFFYKVWGALSSRLRVNKARIEDLHDGVSAHDSAMAFASNVIAALVDNAKVKETWRFAGWISQKINLPVRPSSTPSTLNDRPLRLRRK